MSPVQELPKCELYMFRKYIKILIDFYCSKIYIYNIKFTILNI